MPHSIRPGDVLADRYLLVDLLSETGNGRFWRAHDRTLERHVAVHVVSSEDSHATALMDAARRSATVPDRRILRVLDVDQRNGLCYVVNEWGSGTSLDNLVAQEGPLQARRAAWMVSEVAACLAVAHDAGVAHGRLVPENVLVDESGSLRVIGFCVDAALLGLPPGRVSSDLTDLGALLYFLMTGRWGGVSRSAVPEAPQEAGRVLRPRQVKAGVPRVLDTLCDQLINPWSGAQANDEEHDAAGVAAALRDFVGDPTGMAAAEAAAGRRRSAGATQVLPVVGPPTSAPRPAPRPTPPAPPAVPPVAPPEAFGDPAEDADDRTATAEDAATPPPSTELPTQAGMPVFDDENDEVSWLAARAETPPPPPPFEDPPERPLFAPEPPDGQPVRRPRPRTAAAAAPDYWPWEAHTGTGTGTGSGVIPVADDEEEGDDTVPGRSWLRLAAVIGLSTVLLITVVVAFNLGRGRSPLGTEPADDPSAASPSATPERLSPVAAAGAADLDPQGDPPEENPELAPLVVDGDPATSWRTMTYQQNFGPGGLKTGVGLTIDLGQSTDVGAVDVTFVGGPTSFSVYVTDEAPSGVAGLTAAGSTTADGPRGRVELDEPASGRYVVVWLTSIPAVDGGFRGEVAEVVVRG